MNSIIYGQEMSERRKTLDYTLAGLNVFAFTHGHHADIQRQVITMNAQLTTLLYEQREYSNQDNAMTLAGLYFTLSIMALVATFCAIVPARRIGRLAPLYFLLGWITGELALINFALQLLFTLIMVLCGVMDEAKGQWGLLLFGVSWLGLLYLHYQSIGSASTLTSALHLGLGADYRAEIPSQRHAILRDEINSSEWLRPFSFKRSGVKVTHDIAYGDAGKRNLLDIYQPEQEPEQGAPVLLQVHGGAWMVGDKKRQGLPLMYHMAQRGWVCVAIHYRLSPRDDFPAHIIDVKKAIAWIRENIGQYGGNADFLAITGGSSGGHLSSLAALTPNRQEWQPGFEDADTTISAAVPFYGVFDFLDRANIRGDMSMEKFLVKYVMKCTSQENPELWEAASPMNHISSDAPPMFVVQGSHDSLVWVEEARSFVQALGEIATKPLVYAELPGAQHAFEIFHSVRTDSTVNAVADFLEWSYASSIRVS